MILSFLFSLFARRKGISKSMEILVAVLIIILVMLFLIQIFVPRLSIFNLFVGTTLTEVSKPLGGTP